MTISDERLDQIQVWCDMATEGPWGWNNEDVLVTVDEQVVITDQDGFASTAGRTFIGASRTVVPELLAEVRRLRDAEREHASEVANLLHAHAHHDREQSDEIKRLHQVIDALRPPHDRVEGERNVLHVAMEKIRDWARHPETMTRKLDSIARDALAEVAKMQTTPVAELRAAAGAVIDGPRPSVEQIGRSGMTKIDDRYLNQLQKACDEASPEPWILTEDPIYGLASSLTPQISLLASDSDGWAAFASLSDASFVVEARTALPLLIVEVSRLRIGAALLREVAPTLREISNSPLDEALVRTIDAWLAADHAHSKETL